MNRKTFLRITGLIVTALFIKPVNWFKAPLPEPVGLYWSALVQDKLRKYAAEREAWARVPCLKVLSEENKGVSVEEWESRYPEFQEDECTQYG